LILQEIASLNSNALFIFLVGELDAPETKVAQIYEAYISVDGAQVTNKVELVTPKPIPRPLSIY
jgi:hypothetical protein